MGIDPSFAFLGGLMFGVAFSAGIIAWKSRKRNTLSHAEALAIILSETRSFAPRLKPYDETVPENADLGPWSVVTIPPPGDATTTEETAS